ncbi:MAG: hypothetical protein EOP49_37990, partial [Sphingobacteriales bacterium]
MKKTRISCIAALLLVFCAYQSQAEAIIKGHIRNVSRGSVHIQCKEALVGNTIYFETQLVGDSFEVRLNLLDPAEVQVWMGEEHFTLFTLPNDLTTVDCDARDVYGSLRYTGTHTADDDFLLALDKLEAAYLKEGRQKPPGDIEAYRLWRKQKNDEKRIKLDALYASVKDYPLSEAYKQYAIEGLPYREANSQLLGYILANNSFGGLKLDNGQVLSKAGMDSMLGTLKTENPDLLLNAHYSAFLNSYNMY